jgi:hypothetical protein
MHHRYEDLLSREELDHHVLTTRPMIFGKSGCGLGLVGTF